MIPYEIPQAWIFYDWAGVAGALVEAKAAVLSLQNMPYQRSWVEDLQKIELKREVAGTSRIEGAEFTERELEEALRESPEQLLTRSQKQAHAAVQTYRFIAQIPDDRPIDAKLILEIHRRIITGCDDDHCPPGQLRRQDENVNFGTPRHRGCEGGEQCESAFTRFGEAIQRQFRGHDPLIQALAVHYHLAAMHPFLDGNGRTARALEALMLQRAGLRDVCFIAMSNYYYEEKPDYLAALSKVRSQNFNLTPFLTFGLKGVALQSKRLLEEIKRQAQKLLFRDIMSKLSERLASPRKRFIRDRQFKILDILLNEEAVEFNSLIKKVLPNYLSLSQPEKGIGRDIGDLDRLGAIKIKRLEESKYLISVRLEWPREITKTEFSAAWRNIQERELRSPLRQN